MKLLREKKLENAIKMVESSYLNLYKFQINLELSKVKTYYFDIK